jgi:O-antigen ligase
VADSSPRSRDPIAVGLALLVAAVILWRFDAGFDSFVAPKFAVWSAGVALLLGIAAMRSLAGRPLWILATPTALALLACVLWAELSTTWASSPLLARRAIGGWWVTLATFLLAQHAVWRSRRGGLRWAPAVFVAVVTAVACWALADDFQFDRGVMSRLEDWRGFIAASLGNTGHIADLCGLALLVTLFPFAFARQSSPMLLFAGVACVLLAAAMVVCFSFHSNVALIVGALTLAAGLWGHRRPLLRRWPRFAALAFLWLMMLGFYESDVPGNPHRPGIVQQATSSQRLAWGWGSRLVIWANTLEMIRIHPWVGWGVGSFTHGYTQQASPWVVNRPDWIGFAGAYTNAAHNEILQLWAEQGIVGLGLWVVLFALHFQACGRLMRARRRRLRLAGLWLLALTVMWLLQAQMNFPLQMPVGRMTLALLLAAASALDARARPAGAKTALPLALPLRGWRFTSALVVIVALAGFPVGHAVVAHEVQRRMRRPYEESRFWLRGQSELPTAEARAQWADSDVAWNTLRDYERVLQLDPGFTDARSGMQGMMVEMATDLRGFAESLPPADQERERLMRESDGLLRHSIDQGYRVLEGLSEGAVYRRLAQAEELLGDRDEARRLWMIHFERSPAAIYGPDFQRWLSDPEFRRLWTAEAAGR